MMGTVENFICLNIQYDGYCRKFFKNFLVSSFDRPVTCTLPPLFFLKEAAPFVDVWYYQIIGVEWSGYSAVWQAGVHLTSANAKKKFEGILLI